MKQDSEPSKHLMSRLSETECVILVANNKRIRRRHIRRASESRKRIVFHFNKRKKVYLSRLFERVVFVHRYSEKKNCFFGYPPARYIGLMSILLDSFVVFLGGKEDEAYGANYNIKKVHLSIDENLPLLSEYPSKNANEGGVVSTGFYVLVYLMHLKKTKNMDFEIILVGFSNGNDKLWKGHSWSYERSFIKDHGIKNIEV